jgi:hypothetical protein
MRALNAKLPFIVVSIKKWLPRLLQRAWGNKDLSDDASRSLLSLIASASYKSLIFNRFVNNLSLCF